MDVGGRQAMKQYQDVIANLCVQLVIFVLISLITMKAIPSLLAAAMLFADADREPS